MASTTFRLNGTVEAASGVVGTSATKITSGTYTHVLVQNLGTGNMYVGPSGTCLWSLPVLSSLELDTVIDIYAKCSGAGTTSFSILEIS